MSPGRHGHRAPLLWLLLPYMAGLVAERILAVAPSPVLATAGILSGVSLVCAWNRSSWARRLWPLALGSTVALAGMAYSHLRLARPAVWSTLPPREARLDLRVQWVFPSSAAGRRVNAIGRVTNTAPHLRDLVGERLFFTCPLAPGACPPTRSSVIAALGVLEPLPDSAPDGSFAAYLVNAGLGFQLTRARLLGEVAPPSAYRRLCDQAAGRLHTILGEGLADRPRLAAILRAMLLGQIQELDGEQKNLFMQSGTLHLFAISGQHITVIALALLGLLLLLRVPRLPAAILGLGALWLYVDVTGASPSAVRAFLMCTLFMTAVTLRRAGSVFSALVASALLVLAVDPAALFSASFQMSYGIVAALLLLGVPLAEAMQAHWPLFRDLPEGSWRWHQRLRATVWRWFLGLLGVGLATSLASTMTTVEFFQLLTPGALPANLGLIPISSLVIGAGFASLLCGLAGFPTGSALFNHAAALLLWLMDALLRQATAIPGLFVPARFAPSWIGPAGQAALLAVCLAGCAWQWRRSRGGFWPPFMLVALVLALGVRYGAPRPATLTTAALPPACSAANAPATPRTAPR